jgi:hypothetical protein
MAIHAGCSGATQKSQANRCEFFKKGEENNHDIRSSQARIGSCQHDVMRFIAIVGMGNKLQFTHRVAKRQRSY